MPTVVDSLVIQLGLDAKALTVGGAQAIKAIEGVKKASRETGEQLHKTEQQSHRTSREMAKHSEEVAEGFKKIKEQALELMAVLVGAESISSLVRDTVGELTHLAVASRAIGASVPELAAYRNMVEQLGGSAEQGEASFRGMAKAIDDVGARGTSDRDAFFQWAGGVAKTPQEQMLQAARAAQRSTPAVARMMLRQGGYSDAEIGVIMRGTGAVREALRQGGEAVPSQESAERAREANKAWVQTMQVFRELGAELVVGVLPYITKAVDAMRHLAHEHPWVAQGIGAVGLGATPLVGGALLMRGMWRGLFGGGDHGLTRSAVALDGSAMALTRAAGVLAASGGLRGGLGAVPGGGGRAGRYATSAAAGAAAAGGMRSVGRRIGGRLLRAVPFLGWGLLGWDILEELGLTEGIVSGAKELFGAKPAKAGEGEGGMAPSNMNLPQGQSERGAAITARLAKDLGLTIEQASGITGNLQAESGIRAIQERNPISGRGGFGWAQWTGPRRVAFEKYAKEHGLDPTSDEANYGFLLSELRGDYSGVVGQLRGLSGADVAAQSARIFEGGFEKPKVSNWQVRAAHAARFSRQADMVRNDQVAMNDNSRSSTVNVHGPIVVNTQATDGRGVARSLRAEFANQANTGLA